MIKLEPGTELSNTLAAADEVHNYYFPLEPHQSAQVTFTAPSFEYAVEYNVYKTLEEKGDTADSHEGGEIDFATTTTYSIHNAKDEKATVNLTVAASDQTTLPSDSYTVSMNLIED